MQLNVVFQNIFHGMHFAQEMNGKNVFFKFWPSAYIDYYRPKLPNVVCLAEVPLDNENGESTFLNKFSDELELPYIKTYVNEKSWLVEDKWYGTSILSKFPITSYETFNLPNPKLEIDHKDGTHWVMHDKGAQKVTIKVNDSNVTVYNLHYFPFHHFNRKINEPEFDKIRSQLVDLLLTSDNPLIICGDFNNRGVEIETAFRELFALGSLSKAITFSKKDFENNHEGADTQIDHILYSNNKFELLESSVEANYSDHCGIFAKFRFV
jgi:endonuclease/exonuclease/phosphatase family metal-dependent hydrolase